MVMELTFNKNRPRNAQNENHHLRAPLVPSGRAFHRAIEPAFQVVPEPREIAARVIQHGQQSRSHSLVVDPGDGQAKGCDG
jgi:hypothetical protein